MSGIAGFCGIDSQEYTHVLQRMRGALTRRGGMGGGLWLLPRCCLAVAMRNGEHKNRLALAENRAVSAAFSAKGQPYYVVGGGLGAAPPNAGAAADRACLFDGEIYNLPELRRGLNLPESAGEAELFLHGVAEYGAEYVRKLNGVFAAAVWLDGTLFLFRDPAGVKPLFYTMADTEFIFASEIKSLLKHPKVKAELDADGLFELLASGPARDEHSGIFKNIRALPPGTFLVLRPDCTPKHIKYWELTPLTHTDSEAITVETVRELLTAAVKRQTEAGGDMAAFLSGGVDSSVVTALAAGILKNKGESLRTYSFDFTGSAAHFSANRYQPDLDRPWVEKMAAFLGTEHTYIECGPEDLAEALGGAVAARDLPGMADIDASMLCFCSRLPAGLTALTGECADEIFGGYPWFHSGLDIINEGRFPWSRDIRARARLWSPEILRNINFEERADAFYKDEIQKAVSKVQEKEWRMNGEEELNLRVINYLTIQWFMPALAERMERMGAYAGVNARVPFADAELMAYVFNVPWAVKKKNGVVKYLLREAMRGVAPDEILFRKKSPFPKTYDPAYHRAVSRRVEEDILNNPNAPARDLIDAGQLRDFLRAPVNTGEPWFGQLMAGPQRLAYIWQVNYWLREYKIQI